MEEPRDFRGQRSAPRDQKAAAVEAQKSAQLGQDQALGQGVLHTQAEPRRFTPQQTGCVP